MFIQQVFTQTALDAMVNSPFIQNFPEEINSPSVPEFLITENGLFIITEAGDNLITEG